MKCPRFNELLIELAFGELPAKQRAELEGHLASCSGCQQEQRAILKLRDTLQSQRVADPGEAFWRGLSAKTLERIRAQQASPLQGMYHFIFSPRLAYVAGVVGCLFLFIYMFSHYLLPLSFQQDKIVVQPGDTAIEAKLYQQVLDESLAGVELAYSVWDLSTVELDEFSQRLSTQIKIDEQNYEGLPPAIGYQGEEDIYQLIDQLDAEGLDYIYQLLRDYS